MMKVSDFTEVLLKSFFQNVRDLSESPSDGQNTLSLADWWIQAEEEFGETFALATVWHENLEAFLQQKETLLRACKLTDLAGLSIWLMTPGKGKHYYKVLRT